jgi:sulfite exporter TauE/SafE
MNLWAIFFTGLTSGGLSCLAMQGGLLAGGNANQKDSELDIKSQKKSNQTFSSFDQLDWLPVSLFLFAKLVSHTLLGFLLGWLGSQLELSLNMRLIFQSLAALFMIATALNLLEAHPIFRYVVFQPPKFINRLVRNTSKGKELFTPALLGFLTILVPCGITQSMEVLAITSGNAVQGSLIMAAFVLGTSPLFAVVGVATAKLSETFKSSFMKLAAVMILFLALSSINGVLIVLDSPITFQKVTKPVTYFFSEERFSKDRLAQSDSVITDTKGIQHAKIMVNNAGYTPKRFQVKVGQPVELTVQSSEAYSCATSFVFKEFNIKFQLGPNDTKVAQFTPTEKGEFTFACSMGMYTGIMEVI